MSGTTQRPPGTEDYPRDVFAWPYFNPVSIAQLIAPSMTDVLQQVVPPIVNAIVTQEAQAAVQALALLRAGDTMLGHLFLNHPIPTVDSEAASKLYVDMKTSGAGITEPMGTGNWLRAMNGAGSWVPGLPLTGGLLTGTLGISNTDPSGFALFISNSGADNIAAIDINNTNATASSLQIRNAGTYYLRVMADGSVTAGIPTGAAVTGAGNINIAGTYYKNGVDLMLGAPFLPVAGGTITGRINDSGPFNVGTNLVNRDFVLNAIGELQAFEGAWDAANNDPDLDAVTVNNGSYFIASSAGTAPAALPGIGGDDIRPGDMIVWNGTLSEWQIIPGAGMTQNEADARFLQLAGGTMTAVTGAAGSGTGITLANSASGNGISLTNTADGVGLRVVSTGTSGSAALALSNTTGWGLYAESGAGEAIDVVRSGAGAGLHIGYANAGVGDTAAFIENGIPAGSIGLAIGSETENNTAIQVRRWTPDTSDRWLLRHDGSVTATVDTTSPNAPLLITTTTANNAPEQKFRVGLNGATTVGQPTGPAVTTAGSVNVADNFYRNGVPLTTDQLQFRPMTPDLRNWIPVGLEGTFVSQGTNIVNAPTNGSWRYLAFARASGNLEIIAFQNGNLSVMKPTRTGQLRQRILRTNRDSNGDWSYDSGHNGLTGSWGEYQRPLYSSESQGASIGADNRGGNLMKLAGRNLLERIPGGNINFGPRYSGGAYRNPYNLSLSHARLIQRGSSSASGAAQHLIENIHKLDMATAFGTVMDRSVSGTSIMGFNVDMSPWHEPYGRRWVRYRQFVQPGTARFPFRIAFNVSSPGTYAGWLWEKRVVVILDCRTLGTGARWVRADGTADATDATMIQGMYFPPWLQVRVEFITSHVSADASPSGKVYRVEFDSSYNYGFVTCRVHAFGAAPMTSYAGS